MKPTHPLVCRPAALACAVVVTLCCAAPAFGQTTMASAATPTQAKPTAAAPTPNPTPSQANLGRFAAHVSLPRIIAPMLQLKFDYLLSEQLLAGALLATGSPERQGLTSYSQHELGAHAGYYLVGTVRKGLGVTGQVRGYISSGEQTGDGNSPAFTASGLGMSGSLLVSGRYQTRSRLILQADAGAHVLWTSGTAKGDGTETTASGTIFARLVNLWVGLAF